MPECMDENGSGNGQNEANLVENGDRLYLAVYSMLCNIFPNSFESYLESYDSVPTTDDDGAATDCDITATYAIVHSTVRYNT